MLLRPLFTFGQVVLSSTWPHIEADELGNFEAFERKGLIEKLSEEVELSEWPFFWWLTQYLFCFFYLWVYHTVIDLNDGRRLSGDRQLPASGSGNPIRLDGLRKSQTLKITHQSQIANDKELQCLQKLNGGSEGIAGEQTVPPGLAVGDDAASEGGSQEARKHNWQHDDR